MLLTPRMHHARKALAGFLIEKKGSIEAGLDAVVPGIAGDSNNPKGGAGLTILDHFTRNVDLGMMPLVMIEQLSKDMEWESLDTGSGPSARFDFTFQVWMLVHGREDDVLDDLLSELEGNVSQYLNLRHAAFQYQNIPFFFNEVMPASGASYGAASFQSAIVKGAVVSTTVSSIVTMPPQNGI